MDLLQRTGSSNHTLFFDGQGQQVVPCRCGVTHTGDYAQEDAAHHECLHEAVLLGFADSPDVMCPQCGRSWEVVADGC